MSLLDDYLAVNYRAVVLKDGGDVAARCAADFPADVLRARRDRLKAVEQRCFVSKVAREFLDRALEIKGAA